MDLRSTIIWAIAGLLLGSVVAFGVVQVFSISTSNAEQAVIVSAVQPQATSMPTAKPTIAQATLPATPTLVPTKEPTTTFVPPTAVPATVTSAPTATVKATTVVPTTQPHAGKPAYTEYTVQKGDILSRIAKRYNVSVEAILEANKITNPNNLTVGNVLRIPQ